MYHWFKDPVFLEAYREARRYAFDDMLATLERNGNKAALALVREIDIHTATGSFALIHACRIVIDRVFKAQGSMAVEEELADLRRVVAAVKAGAAPATAPVAEKPAEIRKSMMTEQETAEACRLRMMWMSEIGNSPQDIADSLRWNRPQSVAEEQGLLDVARRQFEWEKQFTGGQFTGG